MAKFKGTVFESTRMFCEKELGAGSAARIVAELSSEDQLALGNINHLEWCPVDPVLRFHHAMDRLYGTGDYGMCVRAGRFSAGYAFNTVLKLFLRFRSPQWLMEKATSVWGRYHDTGRWTFEPAQPGRMTGQLREFAVKDPAFCARLRGWVQGAVELTGGRHAQVVEQRCACRGHDHCAFTATWHV